MSSLKSLAPGSLTGKVALVTGSSRGIGAETIRLLAAAGADVIVNYRDKAARAEKLAAELAGTGTSAVALQADLTDYATVDAMVGRIAQRFGRLDILVLNASGGMERGADEGYALRLNRDAQLNLLDTARPLLGQGARIVFVTSHQAHFHGRIEQLPEYEPVAGSKRAGEDALRTRIPALAEAGIGVVVVSGDMIEGTITAKLLERSHKGALDSRREAAGRLYSVAEFAREVASAAVEEIPAENTRYVGDITGFTAATG